MNSKGLNGLNEMQVIIKVELGNVHFVIRLPTGYPVSEDELKFPIAFSILFYKELEQVENLLRTMYRPHNYYCLHIDADAPRVCLIKHPIDSLHPIFWLYILCVQFNFYQISQKYPYFFQTK